MVVDPKSVVEEVPRGPIRGTQAFVGGLCLLALAGVALWALGSISSGTLRSMGAGMLPRTLAYMVAGAGALLVVLGLLRRGDRIERIGLRGPFFVALAIVAFGLTIRLFGLAVAGPLAMIIGGFASAEVRTVEIVIFSAIMTAFCIGLFRYVLNLPIPIIIIPGVIHI